MAIQEGLKRGSDPLVLSLRMPLPLYVVFFKKRDHFVNLGKLRYSHFLKIGSKYPKFRVSMTDRKKSELLYEIYYYSIVHVVLAKKCTV